MPKEVMSLNLRKNNAGQLNGAKIILINSLSCKKVSLLQ